MTEEEKAIELALQELKSPSWGYTSQLLAVHELLKVDGVPVVARVQLNSEDRSYSVYFGLKGEPYFLVIGVDIENDSIYVVYIEANVRVYLVAGSKRLSSDEITKMLNIIPTKIYIPKFPNLGERNYSWILYYRIFWWLGPFSEILFWRIAANRIPG